MGLNAFELDAASVGYQECGPVLKGLTWSLPERNVLVVFGGGGVGKSTLLRALTGVRVPEMVRSGSWKFRGSAEPFESGRPIPGVVWSGQPPRDFRPTPGKLWPGVLNALHRSDASVVLLDEPNAWIDTDSYDALLDEIRKTAERAAVVLTTHHVAFGRACANQVLLLGGNRQLSNAPRDAFFSDDASEDARTFTRTGNVVPRPRLELPAGLRWVLPGTLGGMGWPGVGRAQETELQSLADAGVTHLVTLTRTALPMPRPPDFGIEGHHFAIQDMGVPTMRAALRISNRIHEWLEGGGKVVVHCRGGMGRTGLVLAMALVRKGRGAEEAIREIRAVNRHYIQTRGQANFVHEFERELRGT